MHPLDGFLDFFLSLVESAILSSPNLTPAPSGRVFQWCVFDTHGAHTRNTFVHPGSIRSRRARVQPFQNEFGRCSQRFNAGGRTRSVSKLL